MREHLAPTPQRALLLRTIVRIHQAGTRRCAMPAIFYQSSHFAHHSLLAPSNSSLSYLFSALDTRQCLRNRKRQFFRYRLPFLLNSATGKADTTGTNTYGGVLRGAIARIRPQTLTGLRRCRSAVLKHPARVGSAHAGVSLAWVPSRGSNTTRRAPARAAAGEWPAAAGARPAGAWPHGGRRAAQRYRCPRSRVRQHRGYGRLGSGRHQHLWHGHPGQYRLVVLVGLPALYGLAAEEDDYRQPRYFDELRHWHAELLRVRQSVCQYCHHDTRTPAVRRIIDKSEQCGRQQLMASSWRPVDTGFIGTARRTATAGKAAGWTRTKASCSAPSGCTTTISRPWPRTWACRSMLRRKGPSGISLLQGFVDPNGSGHDADLNGNGIYGRYGATPTGGSNIQPTTNAAGLRRLGDVAGELHPSGGARSSGHLGCRGRLRMAPA